MTTRPKRSARMLEASGSGKLSAAYKTRASCLTQGPRRTQVRRGPPDKVGRSGQLGAFRLKTGSSKPLTASAKGGKD